MTDSSKAQRRTTEPGEDAPEDGAPCTSAVAGPVDASVTAPEIAPETAPDTPEKAPDAGDGLQGRAAASAGDALDKKELVDRVVARCGVKKREAKPAVEAALAILGAALAEGRELRLEPFGKLKVSNIKTRGAKRVINARLRQNAPSPGTGSDEGAATGTETGAETGEEG